MVRDVDHLIWGTGYQVGIYDFVRVLARPPTETDLQKLAVAGVAADVDAERLAAAPFHEAQAGLGDLYVRLTPPAKYPTVPATKEAGQVEAPAQATVVSSLPSAAASTAATSSPGPELDAAYPRRVPHLHSHAVYARNPTLAFGALIVSVTPFVLGDLLSRYIRAVWEGTVSLPGDFEGRRAAEVERFAVLKARKEELKAEHERQLREAAAAGGDAPTSPPSNLLAFHVLGKNEFDFHLYLRGALLQRKPWLGQLSGLKDDEWTPKRDEERQEMYREKKRWLIRREEERKRRLAAKVS